VIDVLSSKRWKKGQLQDLVFFQRGFDITQAQQIPGPYPVISSSGITSHHAEFKATGPGVVIGRKGTIGSVHFSEGDYWPHDTTLWSKDLRGNNPRFVYYYLHMVNLKRFDVGNSNPTLNRNHIHDLPVLIPPSDVQDRIAGILAAYDDLIENNRRRMELLEDAARQLYREWFVRLRFPGREHTRIINGVPEGWERKTISDIWEINYGKNLPTKDIDHSGKFPVHGADSIIGYYDESNVDGPVCLVTCRGNGSGNIRRTYGPAFVTNNSFIFKAQETFEDVHFHFAMFCLETLSLKELRTGAAQPQLTLSGISHLQVLTPMKRLLRLFNDHADLFFRQIDNLRTQNLALAQARDLLLPRLMSGEIAV
jgi:type I restriction enzyme, S subunit